MNRLDKLFYAVLIVATVAVLLWMSPECVPDPPAAQNSLEEIVDEIELLQAAVEEATKHGSGTIEWGDQNDVGWDVNALAIDTNSVGGVTDSIVTVTMDDMACTSLSICVDTGKEVVLSWESGKLELIGDPNDYTEAAGVFLTEGLRTAAIDLVAADPNAIRKLAKDGHLCKVLGHRWRGGRPGEDGVIYADIHPDTWYRTCTICGKDESRSMTEWGQ